LTVGGQSLVFRVDNHLAAIGLEHVSEVLRPLPVEPLAGVPPYVQGICVLRGRPVPVVDVARLLGLDHEGRSGRFVGVRTGTQTAALAVDTVVGIRDVPLDLLHDLSSVTNSATCAAVGTVGVEPLLLLSTARVIPESVWEALEGAAAT
jgi:purine-binding chemotaxis protein CheW